MTRPLPRGYVGSFHKEGEGAAALVAMALSHQEGNETAAPRGRLLRTSKAMPRPLSGGVSGAISAVVSQPIDTVKANMMGLEGSKFSSTLGCAGHRQCSLRWGGARPGFVTRADPLLSNFCYSTAWQLAVIQGGGEFGAFTHCGPDHSMRRRRNRRALVSSRHRLLLPPPQRVLT